MLRNDPVHTWWIASLVAIAFVYSCAKDGAGSAPEGLQGDNDASAPGRDAAPSVDASADDAAPNVEEDAGAPACVEPIPAGELQDQASGPSVFGQIVGGEYGWYDAFGNTACGVAKARICLLDTETCTESDEAGQFVLKGLPENTDVEISIEKVGLVPTLRLAHIGIGPINLNKTRVIRLDDRQATLESLGIDFDGSRGGLVAVPITPSETIGAVTVPAGVKITIMPGDIEPYYSLGIVEPGGLSSDELDADLETTREGGWALFPGLAPGDYTVRFEPEGGACSYVPGFGFGVDEHGDIRVRVRSGFTTASVAALCP